MSRIAAISLAALLLCGCPWDGDDGDPGPAGVAGAIPPIIGLVDPDVAWAGGEIRISGAGFGSTQGSIAVGGVAVTNILSWTAAEIRATVPAGAGSGTVVVTAGGAASNPGYLVVPWAAADPLNAPVTLAAGDQTGCQVVSDGAAGAIVVWQDNRNGNWDIFAQRVNGAGATLWTPSTGVVISGLASDQQAPRAAPDGAGGAIIAWEDFRGGTWDIYAQRVSAAGAALWVANGAAVSTAADAQSNARIVPDGAGGAVVAWQDFRGGVDLDVYAQRLNGSGAAQWAVNGAAISAAVDEQSDVDLLPDGAGGAILAWQDYRTGADLDVYAQKVNGAGAAQWTANGVAISLAADDQVNVKVATDGAGGAILAWQDARTGTNIDLYAQRVNGAGAVQWTAGGVAVSTAANDQTSCRIVADGAGGAIIAWEDGRNGFQDIFAQRLNASGAVQWGATDLPICLATLDQAECRMVADGAGGAIIAWSDLRDGTSNIYAQRVTRSGVVQWTADGQAVSTAANDQQTCQVVEDGYGGAIIAWEDGRGVGFDLYAQGITAGGFE